MDVIPLFVALDCNALTCLTGPDGDDKIRLNHLLEEIDKRRGKVIIPTPAIAEYLVKADQAALEFVGALDRRACIKMADFDLAAAFEAAQMDAASLWRGDKKDGSSEAWQRVKIDRQIVAIAKANGAKLIVSNDKGVCTCAARVGLKGLRIDELAFPDAARQRTLQIDGSVATQAAT